MHPLHTHIVVQTNSRAQKRKHVGAAHAVPFHRRTPKRAGTTPWTNKHTREHQGRCWCGKSWRCSVTTTHTHIHKHNRHGITTTQKEGKEARKVAGEDRFEEGGGTGGRTAHTHGTRYAHAPEVQCRGRRKPFEPSGPNAVRTPPARSTVPKDARRAPAGVEKKGMRAVTLEADPHGVGIGHSAGANWSEVDRFWPSPRPAHVIEALSAGPPML